MADLTDLQAAQSVKIVGSDATGVEQIPVESATTTPSRTSGGIVVRPLPFETISYAAAAVGFVIAAAATDVFFITGSATKTVRVRRIATSGTITAGSPVKITTIVVRRSSQNTGGTLVTPVKVQYDTDHPAATAVVSYYTANPTALGTLVGAIRSTSTSISSTGMADSVIRDFTDQPIVLRGTSEVLAINFNGVSLTGSIVSISIEWSEV